MLVLERKVQEGFWIDGRIFVKVISIGKRRVKLGIEAPLDLNITRSELDPKGAETPPNGSRDDTAQILPGRRRN